MAIFDNEYNRTWDELNDYVNRSGGEPDQDEYNRLSDAVDDAAKTVPWWERI